MYLNPIIEKEFKIKMRGWKVPVLITIYLLLLGSLVYLFFINNEMNSYYGQSSFNPFLALRIYSTLSAFQFCLLLLILPAITATGISSERERQTLDLLICSGASKLSIIWGKIMLSMAYIMLIIIASLPIMGVIFLFGGVSLLDLLYLFLFYLVTGLMASSIGIYYSTVFKKNAISIIMSYITMGFLTGGTLIIMFIYYLFKSRFQGPEPSYEQVIAFLFANPLFGFSSFVSPQGRILDVFF